jgi:hypothetical protein
MLTEGSFWRGSIFCIEYSVLVASAWNSVLGVRIESLDWVTLAIHKTVQARDSAELIEAKLEPILLMARAEQEGQHGILSSPIGAAWILDADLRDHVFFGVVGKNRTNTIVAIPLPSVVAEAETTGVEGLWAHGGYSGDALDDWSIELV